MRATPPMIFADSIRQTASIARPISAAATGYCVPGQSWLSGSNIGRISSIPV